MWPAWKPSSYPPVTSVPSSSSALCGAWRQVPDPVATYTYWYAPDAGAIVKFEETTRRGKTVAAEADIIGYPLPIRSRTAAGAVD